MTTKDKVKKAMSQVDNILSSLCDENAALKKRNEYLEAKIGKIEDTEEVLRTVMKEKNKWWFLDSIEESVYRNVIEVIQKM
jgi:regulator of replication initiation timing